MLKEHQGVSAGLVSTPVNYSVSTGLGIAGTIARHASGKHRPGLEATLAELRAGWYFGIGLSGCGLLVAAYSVWQSRKRP